MPAAFRSALFTVVLVLGGWRPPSSPLPLTRAGSTPPDGWSVIDAGGRHTCGVATNATAYCWGRGVEGQLGHGANVGSAIPVAVSGGLSFVSVTAGEFHSCGLTSSGSVYCWGVGTRGQLGNGAMASSSVPLPVSGGHLFSQISAGSHHTCGLTTAGASLCWGLNNVGQLGDGSSTDRDAPVPSSGGRTYILVSSGGSHTCSTTAAYSAFCWGWNQAGQLGIGSLTDRLAPAPVASPVSFARVFAATGADHTCGAASDGAPYCWGAGGLGQLGIGTAPVSVTAPTAVSGGHRFFVIGLGTQFSCGVTSVGAAYCWGASTSGKLGNGSTVGPDLCNAIACSTNPVPVSGSLAFVSLSVGAEHACGVTADGAAYCWGEGIEGQLGNSSMAFSSVPVAVALITPTGTDVQVTPVDPTTGLSGPATVTFGSVSGAGVTTVTSGTVGQGGGPPPPANFRLGNPPTYYDISTTATFTGAITVCFSYAGTAYSNPSNLKLLHLEGGAWVDITTSNDVAAEVICGSTTSLSPFLFAQPLYAFTGFYPPILNRNPDGTYALNVARAGRTIQVTFSLGGDFGLNVVQSGYPTSSEIACDAITDAVGGVTAEAAGGNRLSYRRSTGQYTFRWKTERAWIGCRQLTVKLDDGSEHSARFKFTK